MKSVVLLCDGMADTPCPELGGRTPMEAARKPAMDALAAVSEIGLVRTVPDGMAPGSDVANLTMMGYGHPGLLYRAFSAGSRQHRASIWPTTTWPSAAIW